MESNLINKLVGSCNNLVEIQETTGKPVFTDRDLDNCLELQKEDINEIAFSNKLEKNIFTDKRKLNKNKYMTMISNYNTRYNSIKDVLEDLEKKVAYSNEINEVPSKEIIEANNDYKNQIIASNDLTRDMIRSVVELKKDIVDKYSNVENKQYKDLVNSYRFIKVNDDDEYNLKNDISYITEKNNTISKKLKDSNKTNRYLMIILIILVLITGASIFLFIRV